MVDFPRKRATTIAFLRIPDEKMVAEKSLDKLRQEIDKIDETIHSAIIRRAEIVEQIGSFKAGKGMPALRPAREAEILRRLVSRHQGRFPKTALLRIWREMIGAMVAIEAPLVIGVTCPSAVPAISTWRAIIMVPIRPPPCSARPARWCAPSRKAAPRWRGAHARPRGHEPWWISLMGDAADLPRIIARLPFLGPGRGRGDGIEALAIARLSPDPPGLDRSCRPEGLEMRLQSILQPETTPSTPLVALSLMVLPS